MALTEPLSIRQLEVFVALVEQGSFTKAARHLQLSQSTVSGHVADLERRLDVRLVERERSGVRTTAAGQALLRPAREVLQAERNARMSVQELSGLLKGTLTVGASTIPASYLLPGLLARFHARHEGVALRVLTGDSRQILERVRTADVEIGVVGAPPRGEGVEDRLVGEDRLVLILPRDHALARRDRVRVQDVLAHPLVMREDGSGTRAAIEEALGRLVEGRTGDAAWRVACEVGSTEAQRAAVAAGLGLAFVSNLAVENDISAGTVATVAVEGFEVRRRFHLVSRPDPLLSPAARAFRDMVPASE